MNKKALTLLALCLPLLLAAATLSLEIEFDNPAQASGWGTVSAPGRPQLPVKTVNVILPPGAANLQYSHAFSELTVYPGPAPAINPGFGDGERVLSAPDSFSGTQQITFTGLGHWGDIAYAGFRVSPAIHAGTAWQSYRKLSLNLSWDQASAAAPNRIPPVLNISGSKGGADAFFANPQALKQWYADSPAKNYDYLIVSTPGLYSAVGPLEAFHQSQGMITAFADIATILATSPGATNGEKLRNHLIAQYSQHPFSYLLLVGDYDTVPVMYLTPEPEGYETVASDFFYGDLSSVVDTDGDNRLGEYSAAAGDQDFMCDFTPEVFVGRISTNSATQVAQIASRSVAFEQSTAAWKRDALLPAAFLNYGGEPEPIYLQTDGATFMEYAKTTALNGYQCTTMYEQTGYLPSYASDVPMDYNALKNLLSTNNYGILNWSAHGSSGSSSRKVWMNDGNSNGLPDSWEMQWMDMVDRQSFDNLASSEGLILFAASCNNGQLDSSYSQCIAEYALQKRAVAVSAATRTGWYKIGWANPGWGGLSSYNLHWLENLAQNGMSVGAAQAYANLTHTQLYLFGDPVDAGGIIYPELQNIYTYLLFGDPAIGHTGAQTPPQGEILVYEPFHQDGLPVAAALSQAGRFNVVYTDKLIPDYDYISRFDAIFCLFGWGDTAYILQPDSLDYNLLNGYLAGGGRLYLEGDVGWDPQDPFWGKFGTHCPVNALAYIEALDLTDEGQTYIWQYDQDDPWTMVLIPYAPTASELVHTHNAEHPIYPVGIYNGNGNYRTIASSFALSRVLDEGSGLPGLLSALLDTLGVLEVTHVSASDPALPAARLDARNYPNPFAGRTTLRFELAAKTAVTVSVFNLRGQKLRTLRPGTLDPGSHDLVWDGRGDRGEPLPSGVYLWRLEAGTESRQGRMLKLAD